MSASKKNDNGKKTNGRFLNAFLFTENGKPKSSLLTYTFCLSFVFAAVYVLCYICVIELLTSPMASIPVFAANLCQSLLASVLGAGVCSTLHFVFKDKRLVFGGHLWLCLYAVAILITMLIMLQGTDGVTAFLVFFGWFAAAPVLLGFFITWRLYKRDYKPPKEAEEQPEWKKYVSRE